MLIQVMCGIDRKGDEFVGNKQTYKHSTVYINTDFLVQT